MTLLTAHRILIATAVACFVFYAVYEFRGGLASGAGGPWLRGLMALLGAGALAVYFVTLFKRRGRSGDPGGGSR